MTELNDILDEIHTCNNGADCVRCDNQVETNQKAYDAVFTAYSGLGYKNLIDIASSRPTEFSSVYGVHGGRCSVCRGKVTIKNIQYANFNPEVRCFFCQGNKETFGV